MFFWGCGYWNWWVEGGSSSAPWNNMKTEQEQNREQIQVRPSINMFKADSALLWHQDNCFYQWRHHWFSSVSLLAKAMLRKWNCNGLQPNQFWLFSTFGILSAIQGCQTSFEKKSQTMSKKSQIVEKHEILAFSMFCHVFSKVVNKANSTVTDYAHGNLKFSHFQCINFAAWSRNNF